MKLAVQDSCDTMATKSDSPIMLGILTCPIDYVIEKAKLFGRTGNSKLSPALPDNEPLRSASLPLLFSPEYRSQMRYLFMRQQLSRRLNIPAPRGLQHRNRSHDKRPDAA